MQVLSVYISVHTEFSTGKFLCVLWVVQRNRWEGCEVQSVVLRGLSFRSSHDQKRMGHDQISYCSWVTSRIYNLSSFRMCLCLYIVHRSGLEPPKYMWNPPSENFILNDAFSLNIHEILHSPGIILISLFAQGKSRYRFVM